MTDDIRVLICSSKTTPEGRERFDKMLDSVFSSDARFDRMISDNLSAYFKNDLAIIDKYDMHMTI